MATIICKITSDAEIRRFTCQVESVTYKSIHKRTKEMLSLEFPFRLTYTDDEGDVITMSTDEEMAEAVGLALSCLPAVLRLTVMPEKPAKAEATTDPEPESEPDQPRARAAPATPDFSALLSDISKTLPTIMAPRAAANAGSATAEAFASACSAFAPAAAAMASGGFGYGDRNVHPGVTCDKSGMSPIVGNRYHLTGHNYDLCEAEYLKLPPEEQGKFKKMSPPFSSCSFPSGTHCPDPKYMGTPGEARHWGVTCDKSGMSPIVGNRYHLIGHNYDLCEAEYLKLPPEEQGKFEKIPSPQWGGRCRWKQHGGMHHGGPHHGGMHHKLAARFVSDVAIFDGTQIAPQTSFTKIWRIKNVGEVPWPPGTKMLFVGGDRMSAEMTVPLTSRVVLPGHEVDVAVDMVAPAEVGRYIGYWRLQGPHGRRFGQKVWCHVQVVDLCAATQEEDFLKVQEEVATMMAKVTHDDDDDMEPAPPILSPPEPKLPDPLAAAVPAKNSSPATLARQKDERSDLMDPSSSLPEELAAASDVVSSFTKSSAILVEEPKQIIATELLSMGFTDQEMIEHTIEKNDCDLEACARDLVALNEWDTILADLEEMGFGDASLNKKLMIKNGGSVKRTVKDLVADSVA